MSNETTALPISPSWMHPDLRRQLQERVLDSPLAAIRRITQWDRAVHRRLLCANNTLQTKQKQIAEMQSTLEVLRRDVLVVKRERDELAELSEGLNNQVHFHKSMSSVSFGAKPVLSGFDGVHHEPGSPIQAASSSSPTTAATSGRSTPIPSNPFFVSPLEVHFLHFLGRQLTSFFDDAADAGDIQHFLDTFAPLFSWDAAEGCVQPPFFFDEPCLIEETGTRCANPACVYWHQDQLDHVKTAVSQRFLVPLHRLHVRDARLCAVASFFTETRRVVESARSLDSLLTAVTSRLQTFVGQGWAAYILRPSGPRGWPAPVAAALNFKPSPAMAGACPLREEIFADPREWEAWGAISTHPDRAAPTSRFVEDPTALSWRCLIRAQGLTPAQRFWLADQGRQLFPSSPQLQVLYVHLVLTQPQEMEQEKREKDQEEQEQDTEKDTNEERQDLRNWNNSLAKGGGLEKRLGICLSVAQLLSGQAAGAALTLGDSFCAEAFARAVAYVLARAAVHAAESGDAASCVRVLETALGGASSETQSNNNKNHNNNNTAFVLLPKARVNLTLMLISARQRGGLGQAALLPLASISDQLWVLGMGFVSTSQECGGALLARQLELIEGCQRAGLDADLVEEMKAAVQVSLLRVFGARIVHVEQILRRAVADATLTQAELWSEYFHRIAELDSPGAAGALALRLLADEAEPVMGCTLTVLTMWFVRGKRAQTLIRDCARRHRDRFMQKTQLDLATWPSSSALRSEKANTLPEIPAVEWVAFYILHAMHEPTVMAQYDCLSDIPPELYASDANAVGLLLLEQVRLAAALEDRTRFEESLKRALYLLRHPFLTWWSPLDIYWDSLIALPHTTTLMVYSIVPLLLGLHGERTMEWRLAILNVAAELDVLHPLLREPSASARTVG